MEAPNPQDGPSMEQYLETRFNLLLVTIDKMEHSLRERIEDVGRADETHHKHQSEITQILREAAREASDKVESTQHDINIAANDWRNSFNDYKKDAATRLELDRVDKSLDAFKLEIANTISARLSNDAGLRLGAQENRQDNRYGRDDSRATWAIAVAIGALAVQLIFAIVGNRFSINDTRPSALSIPPGYVLVPATPTPAVNLK